MTEPASVLMWVGEDNYTLANFIDEAEFLGVSKRIPITAIPEGLVPYRSKIFLAHAKAILKTTKGTLQDLAYALVDADVLTHVQLAHLVELEMPFWDGAGLEPYDFVPECMLDIAYAFSRLPSGRQTQLVKDLGIEFMPGVFGFAPLTGVQYVVRKGETGLPNSLSHLEGYVEPVDVRYTDDGQGSASDGSLTE